MVLVGPFQHGTFCDSVIRNTNQTGVTPLYIDIVNYLIILNSFCCWTEVQCFTSGNSCERTDFVLLKSCLVLLGTNISLGSYSMSVLIHT